MTFNIQYITKRKWKLIGAAFVFYVIYRIFTGYFGPIPVRINVSNADVDNIVVKLVVRGISAPISVGHTSINRSTLYEEVRLVKANELTEFPRAYMWMALDPVEYLIEVYHPALKREHKVVKVADLKGDNNIPITEINVSLISELIDDAKQNYDSPTQHKKEFYKSSAKDRYHESQLMFIREHYAPAMKDAQKGTDEIYQQVKQFLVDCEKLFTTFDYGKECDISEALLKKRTGLTGPGWDDALAVAYNENINDYWKLERVDKYSSNRYRFSPKSRKTKLGEYTAYIKYENFDFQTKASKMIEGIKGKLTRVISVESKPYHGHEAIYLSGVGMINNRKRRVDYIITHNKDSFYAIKVTSVGLDQYSDKEADKYIDEESIIFLDGLIIKE